MAICITPAAAVVWIPRVWGKIAGKLVGNEVQRKLEERIDDSLGDKAPELRDAIKGLFSR